MVPGAPRDQVRLWLMAFVVSLSLNVVVVAALGWWILDSLERKVVSQAATAVPETVVTIVPVTPSVKAEPEVPPAPSDEKPFARTSADQEAAAPEKPAFTGERSTQATSDAPAVTTAPPLPSQQGREPHYEGEIETTESDYQDGDLNHRAQATPEANVDPVTPVTPVEETQAMEDVVGDTRVEETPPSPDVAASREKLAEGPLPIDREVKMESPEETPRPKPAPAQAEQRPQEAREAVQEKPKPSKDTPGFTGFQRKTQLQGSISRRGRSALDVEESLLGRYHAELSRAVEREWQLNCVRNRDYITPGMLRVRFFLDPSGKVRSVDFVEEFGVGTIQKGFTLNSIRDAKIPPMPADLKKQLNGEPLELIYNFIF